MSDDMTKKRLMDNVEADEMFNLGATVLGSAAKIFMEEARARQLDQGDAILLFCSVLVHKAVSVIRLLTPGEDALEVVLNLVRKTWEEDFYGRPTQN